MKWYLNMNIGKKLVAAFVLVALICGGMGVFAVYNIKTLANSDMRLHTHMTVPLSQLGELSTEFQRTRVNARDMISAQTPEDIQANIDKINEREASIELLGGKFESTLTTDKMRKNYETFQSAYKNYCEELDKVIILAKANNDAAAIAAIAEEGTAGVASRAVQDSIAQLMSDKEKRAEETSNANMAQANRTAYITIIISIAVILLAILLGILIASIITRPIKKALYMMEEMSKGHVQERLNLETKDEVGQMARAMDFFADELQTKVIGVMNRISAGDVSMEVTITDDKDEIAPALKTTVETIRALNIEVQKLIQAATEGKLDMRGDSAGYSGSWKDMIEGINGLVDAFVAPINMTAEYVERISKGDIPPRITDTYLGDFNEIKNNINNCIEVMSGLVDETGKLIQDAQEGKLDTRGNAAAFSGEWGDLVSGINSILDSIVKPLKFSADYIQRMAAGEYVEEIKDEYKGEYKLLMDAQLSIRGSLNLLVGEIMAITKATDEGDLTVRGDIQKFKGGYQDIIGGFNNILDMVIAPLNEAEQVLGKLSVNDFSLNMAGQYKGTLKDFADSINEVIERLLSMQDATVRIGNGDTSRLEELLKIGKRSENDQLIPSLIFVNQAIKELIHEVTTLAESVLRGDLSARADTSKFKGGYREIIDGFNRSIDVMVESVNETSSVMKELAAGNLDISMDGDYKGDFARLQDDINMTVRSINEVLNDINEASDQVASGSRQVSDGSQALSQGSTEQASSIEELTASIAEIADQTKQNAVNANKANELSSEVMETAMLGNKQMTEMLRSMSEINESSSNISKIIKVIDDIAFQTNILALNAAVEAARAGQHGKGFAVVAEEVRNLAARSAEAAKETTGLIEGSINKVQEGTGIANNTAAALDEIVKGIEKTSDIIAEIATASNEQASGISQINKGVDQVSLVVQNNSATAEESAAASEELSGQAELLKEMVGKFRLRKGSFREGEPKLLKDSSDKSLKQGDSSKIILIQDECDKY